MTVPEPKKGAWPEVTMVRFAEHVRLGNPQLVGVLPWVASEPEAWTGPTGYETTTYLPITQVRERLLSDEAKQAALDVLNGWRELPAETARASLAAVEAALEAAGFGEGDR